MRRGVIHPDDEISSISSDDAENHSRCSLTHLFRTRRRSNLFIASIVIIILLCAISIPLALALGYPEDAQQLPTTTTNTTLNSTVNTDTLSTINLDDFMNSTHNNISFVQNSTLKSSNN